MSQQIIIAEQARIAALLKDDRVDELIVAQGQYQIGDIFLGTVENVLPGIDAAFINIVFLSLKLIKLKVIEFCYLLSFKRF